MSHNRRGFTLVELLVVAGIMAVLFSLIVAGGRPRPTALRAAQDFASMLLATQSRALGKPQGAAIIIETDATLTTHPTLSANATRYGAVIHEADTLPPIVIPLSANDYGVHKNFPDVVTVPDYQGGHLVPGNASSGDVSLLQTCYKVRFRRIVTPSSGGVPPGRDFVTSWLGLRAVAFEGPDGWKSGTAPVPTGTVGLPVRRSSAGQGSNSTFTPNVLFGPPDTRLSSNSTALGDYEAVVVRYPTVGLQSLKIPSSLAIDLLVSGVGDDPMNNHGYFSFNGTTNLGMSPLAIVFDQTGRVSEVIQQARPKEKLADLFDPSKLLRHTPGSCGVAHADPTKFCSVEHPNWRNAPATDPLVPNEIIYFLFVDRSAITANQSLASESAAWVAIDPLTGRISVSSNVPDAPNIAAARARARSSVAFGK